MLYQKVCEEKTRLENMIQRIEVKLKELPLGKMYISRNGKHFKWYYRVDKDSDAVYIPKRKRKLAEQYAQKKYLQLLKKDLEHEYSALDFYVRHHKERP